ncbi:hypothetical protein [Rhodoluna sp. KAS3]|uniref:hypothetical protein n=1 Tax=Rhodoluna sp. KAS3 TaxID=942880 RepID=UPI0022306A5E|nr:hypothetical protein [Rhodoluna sp. KAS3]BDS49360.1 hypothetical protein RKAS3_09370 [Rhodoluna sp. KAS3]
MDILFSALLAATPSPSVDPANTFYSPGTIGFLAVFAMAAGAIGLIFDMVRRVRRVRYRAEIESRLDAEDAQATPVAIKTPAKKPSAPSKPARPAPPAKPKRD